MEEQMAFHEKLNNLEKRKDDFKKENAAEKNKILQNRNARKNYHKAEKENCKMKRKQKNT